MALEPPGRAALQPSDSECCRAAQHPCFLLWSRAASVQPGVQPSILSPLWAHLLGLSAHLGSPQLLSLRAGPTGKHVSVEKVYRSLGPLLQENSFLLPKPGQVAFLLGLTLQEEKTRLRRLGCEWPGSTGSQSSQEPLPFLSPLVSFPCKQDPKRVVSLPRPSCRLRWVREPSSLNKQQGCLPGPSLCTPSPWPFRKTFRPHKLQCSRSQAQSSSPQKARLASRLPPQLSLSCFWGAGEALETGGTYRAGTGKTLAQPKRGWEGKPGNKGHATRCGASFRATSLGTQVHAGPPSDPGWVASPTLPRCSLADRTPVPPLPSPGPCRKVEAVHPVLFIESLIRGGERRADHQKQWLMWGCGLGKSGP